MLSTREEVGTEGRRGKIEIEMEVREAEERKDWFNLRPGELLTKPFFLELFNEVTKFYLVLILFCLCLNQFEQIFSHMEHEDF